MAYESRCNPTFSFNSCRVTDECNALSFRESTALSLDTLAGVMLMRWNSDMHGIYVKRMIKYMNSHAANTAAIAPKISHVMPVEVLLYACNRPPVADIRSAFFDKRP